MNEDTKKLLIIGGSIVGGLLLIIIIVFIIGKAKPTYISYSEFEEKLVSSTKEYVKNIPSEAPTTSTEKNISYDTLHSSGYIDSIDEYLEDGSTCSAYVIVKNIDDEYSFYPYLTCGSNYNTIELYKQILNDNQIVSNGIGLYNVNNKYIFRGDATTNYISLDSQVYRIIRINEDNTVTVVSQNETEKYYTWDDRYNEEQKSKVGINDFEVSRMKESLEALSSSEYNLISADTKNKLVPTTLCIGKRSDNDTSKDNSIECSVLTEKKYYYGLITTSDYLYASLDENCTNTLSKSCMNYNYLASLNSSLTLTANEDTTYKVYYTSKTGVRLQEAFNSLPIHITLTISSNAIYSSGNGTLTNPYIIK